MQSLTQIPFHSRSLTHTYPGRFSYTCSSLCLLHSGLKQSVGAFPCNFQICLSFLSFLAKSLGIFIGLVFKPGEFSLSNFLGRLHLGEHTCQVPVSCSSSCIPQVYIFSLSSGIKDRALAGMSHPPVSRPCTPFGLFCFSFHI